MWVASGKLNQNRLESRTHSLFAHWLFLCDDRILISVVFTVAGMSVIAFHFMAMTKTNKFNGGDFLQVCTSLWEC